jgi:plasmid maintenance system antidote protein VapI
MNGFLDFLKTEFNVKTDRALAQVMEVTPPVVSKWRKNTLSFGASMILRVHDLTDMPIKEIKERLRHD